MIFTYQPFISWPFFFGILTAVSLAGLVPLVFQWRKGLAGIRLAIRAGLFFLFLVCLSMLIFRPMRTLDPQAPGVLVIGQNIDRSELAFWKDSLKIRRTVALEDFEGSESKVYLLAHSIEREESFRLANQDFEWILPEKHGLVTALSWKGYLRKGEVQRLGFRVFSEKDSAKLQISGNEKGELVLQKGWNSGILEFFPTGLGKAEFPLVLDADTLAPIRFHIGASHPKSYHFQLDFPSMEIRTLANWLREKGERVGEEIRLSRETILQTPGKYDSLQVLFVDPAQLNQKSVQELVKSGNAALVVLNVSQPAETALQLNRLFGTDFQVEKSGPDESRRLENGLEALPYQWTDKTEQKLLQERTIALQYAGSSPIAVTLIPSSFPLILQDKKAEYESIWGEILGLLEPDEEKSFAIEAPVLQAFSSEIQVFSTDSLPDLLPVGQDTISMKISSVNPFQSSGIWTSSDSAWAESGEDLSFYSYTPEQFPQITTSMLLQEIQNQKTKLGALAQSGKSLISPWIWIIGMCLTLGLMWLEPKVSYSFF
ncbi:hypothetical protein [Algoriphagus sp. A40]|uniref:hypothetical protein n=1 Tax=Algoriphagus sp. A40 TaxID=1945863 RepID=UPI000984C2BE|nr:hypothetical protein [Algoriphagus sp. A40]OOG72830.1 hypothetical protein B0E43_15340 [Algoriphagus sp. A40]